MSQLYSSLDKLLFLSSVTDASSRTTFAPQSSGFRKQIPASKSHRAISPSILDLPAVQAAATHSKSRRVSDLPEGDQAKQEVEETLRLEEEIREMERKVSQTKVSPHIRREKLTSVSAGRFGCYPEDLSQKEVVCNLPVDPNFQQKTTEIRK